MAKITTITSQIDDGSTALTEFSSVQEAKDWFYTAQAQQCSEDNSNRVEYQVMADGNGKNTILKRTEEWLSDGSGQVYNNAKIQLIDDGNWSANQYTSDLSDDHLF